MVQMTNKEKCVMSLRNVNILDRWEALIPRDTFLIIKRKEEKWLSPQPHNHNVRKQPQTFQVKGEVVLLLLSRLAVMS